MAEKLSYTPVGSLKGERDEAEDEEKVQDKEEEERAQDDEEEGKAQAKAFLDGYVQEAADGDIDLDLSSAKQIKEEAIRMQFDQLGRGDKAGSVDSVQQAYEKGRELARAGERINLQYEHENEIQELVDMTDLADVPKTVQKVTDLMFPEGEDISTGRLAVLLSFCYKLIKKVLRTEVVVGAVVVGAVVVILYQVFKRIDFFKWLVRKGGWAALQYAQDSVDAGRSAISRWWYGPAVQTVVGAGITVAPCATETRLPGRVAATFSRNVRFGAPRVLPVAVAIALVGAISYYLWRKRSD